jgi:2-C-methyl-D-erythritol 2,4-cyclodiphosphate synthase
LPTRIGNGFDVHQLEAGTPLIIGGVSIPFHKGSMGHSDGDVLLHAIVDALLGPWLWAILERIFHLMMPAGKMQTVENF